MCVLVCEWEGRSVCVREGNKSGGCSKSCQEKQRHWEVCICVHWTTGFIALIDPDSELNIWKHWVVYACRLNCMGQQPRALNDDVKCPVQLPQQVQSFYPELQDVNRTVRLKVFAFGRRNRHGSGSKWKKTDAAYVFCCSSHIISTTAGSWWGLWFLN